MHDGVDENAIAQYLLAEPGFFERHAELLTRVQLASPNGGRTISLQERQAEALREKNRPAGAPPDGDGALRQRKYADC